MRKLLCSNSKFERVFAHILDDGTVDIMRQDQRFTIIGRDFTLIGTNPQGRGKTVLVVKDGKLVEDGLQFKKEDSKDGKENSEGAEPANNGDGEGSEPPVAAVGGQPAGDDPDGGIGDNPSGTDPDPDSGSGSGAESPESEKRKHTVKL